MIDSSSLQTWPVGSLTCLGSNMTFHGFTARWQDRGPSPGLLACGCEETAAKDLGKETGLGEVGWALTWSLSSFWICVDLVSFQLLSFSKGTIALELIGFLKNQKNITGRDLRFTEYHFCVRWGSHHYRCIKRLLQHHGSKASIFQCSAFLRVQLSHPYMTTGKTIALTIQSTGARCI